MKKLIKHAFIITFFSLIIFLFFPVNAQAGSIITYKNTPKKIAASKKYVTVKKSKLYEITIPKNSYIKLEIKDSNNSSTNLAIYKKVKKTKYEYLGYCSKKINTFSCVNNKCYIYAYKDCKIRYSICKLTTNKNNYCLSNAVKLKSSQKETISLSDKNSFSRWYKITLSKPQKLTIHVDTTSFDYNNMLFDLYDQEGGEITFSGMQRESESIYTRVNLEKGTYYLRVYDDLNVLGSHELDYINNIVTIWWK